MTALTTVPFKYKPATCMSETAVRLMLRTHYMMHVYYAMTFVEVEEDNEDVKTLATNGTTCWINPKFWRQLTKEQRLSAVAHEMGHRMCLHSSRRGDRDPEIWNIAGDHVINLMLQESKFAKLEGLTIDGKKWSWWCDAQYTGWTTEAVYDALVKEFEDGDDGDEGARATRTRMAMETATARRHPVRRGASRARASGRRRWVRSAISWTTALRPMATRTLAPRAPRRASSSRCARR
jgi:hypothetical protein